MCSKGWTGRERATNEGTNEGTSLDFSFLAADEREKERKDSEGERETIPIDRAIVSFCVEKTKRTRLGIAREFCSSVAIGSILSSSSFFSCLFLRLARSTFLRFSLLPTFTRCLSPLRRTIFIRDLSVPSSGCVLRDTGRRDGSSLTDAEIKRTTYIAKNLTFNKEQERYLSPAVRTTWI